MILYNPAMFRVFTLVAFAAIALAAAAVADISGKWTASIESAIGVQNYSYEFKAEGAKLTGTAKSDSGVVAIENGKIEGDIVSFVERRDFDGNVVPIEYKGKIVSANEIRFTRVLEAFGATEELVAKRTK